MNDQTAFSQLLANWHGIVPPASPLGQWQQQLDALKHDQARLVEEGRWLRGRDDFFGVLRLQRRETLHSAAIAWLIDPAARHGLGVAFLQALLGHLFPDETFAHLHAARAVCEVTRGPCRADIVIELPGLLVVIENKVDALESPRQCAILYEQFGPEPNTRYVFLTPDARAPHTAEGRPFVCLGYATVRRLLAEALQGSLPSSVNAPRGPATASGRPVAEDYLRTLQKEFPRDAR